MLHDHKRDADPKRRYGNWAGNPGGQPQDPANCVRGVWPNDRGPIEHQCTRLRGRGKDGLYCAQHAKDDERAEAREREWKESQEKDAVVEKKAKALSKRIGHRCPARYNWGSKPRDPKYSEHLVIPFSVVEELLQAAGK